MRVNRVYNAINVTPTVGGADKPMAVLNGTFAAAATMATGTVYFVVVAVFVHVFLKWMTKQDPWFRPVYITFNNHGEVYEPWPAERSRTRYSRPAGFCRDLPC